MIWPRHQIGWKESEIVPFMYFFVDILRVDIGVHLADFGNRFQIRYYSLRSASIKARTPFRPCATRLDSLRADRQKFGSTLVDRKKEGLPLLEDLSLSSADG